MTKDKASSVVLASWLGFDLLGLQALLQLLESMTYVARPLVIKDGMEIKIVPQ